MKTTILNAFILLLTVVSNGQKKDFGPNGLNGISAEKLQELSKGDVVLLNEGEGKNTLIEAAIVFNATPEVTWKLLSKTDDQPKYIGPCKEIKVLTSTPQKAVEVHTVGNALATFNYGVLENYDAKNKCLLWMLDTSYRANDVDALNGYWQFYLYDKDKTLARYGSKVSFKKVPEFLENMFKKGGVKDALASVKKYVDSGGTYKK